MYISVHAISVHFPFEGHFSTVVTLRVQLTRDLLAIAKLRDTPQIRVVPVPAWVEMYEWSRVRGGASVKAAVFVSAVGARRQTAWPKAMS